MADFLESKGFKKLNENHYILNTHPLTLELKYEDEEIIVNVDFKEQKLSKLNRIFTKTIKALPQLVGYLFIPEDDYQNMEEIADEIHEFVNNFYNKLTINFSTNLDDELLNKFLEGVENTNKNQLIYEIVYELPNSLFNGSESKYFLNYEFNFKNKDQMIYSEKPEIKDIEGSPYIHKKIEIGKNTTTFFASNTFYETLSSINSALQYDFGISVDVKNLNPLSEEYLYLHIPHLDNDNTLTINYKGDLVRAGHLKSDLKVLFDKYLLGYPLYQPIINNIYENYNFEFKYNFYYQKDKEKNEHEIHFTSSYQKLMGNNAVLENLEDEEIYSIKFKGKDDLLLEEYLNAYNFDFSQSIQDWPINPLEFIVEFSDEDLYEKWFEEVVYKRFGDQYIKRIELNDKFKVFMEEDENLVYEFPFKEGNFNQFFKYFPEFLDRALNDENILMENYQYFVFRVKDNDLGQIFDLKISKEGTIILDDQFLNYIPLSKFLKLC